MIKKIRISGHVYSVVVDKELEANDRTSAQVHLTKHIISVCPYQAESSKAEGVLHEIVEALNSQFELKLEHPKITTLSQGLFQVLVDNPKLVKYLADQKR